MRLEKQDIIIQNQIALFNVLGSLVYKLTGEIPIVEVQTRDGTVKFYPTVELVKYQDGVVLSGAGHQTKSHIDALP